MVKHIIVWTLKEEFSDSEKAQIKEEIKNGLEGLMGVIPGIVDIHVYTDKLESSSGDLLLDSSFENGDALKTYASHPAHVAVADGKVRPYVKIRSSFDYEV